MTMNLNNKQQLRQATIALQTRGLKKASKWAAEMLLGLVEGNEGSSVAISSCAAELLVEKEKTDRFLMAKSYFDLGEFQRAAFVLNPLKGELDSYELFLRCYALFLAGEKTKEQQALELNDPLEQLKVVNPGLQSLHMELLSMYQRGRLDAFGLYIFGVVLKELSLFDGDDGAYHVLCESVRIFPWNWSAWLDISEICAKNPKVYACSNTLLDTSQNDIGSDNPAPWTRDLFLVHNWIQIGGVPECNEALHTLNSVRELFPNSTHVLSQSALAKHELKEYVGAEEMFEELRQVDPYRVENMDIYSNLLYIKDNHATLSHLAHVCIKLDKYSPETCCVIGNYYSIKGNHVVAVTYFQRALKVNPKCQSAWILMGHEFVELRNTASAIEAYRRGADVNPKDFRAWYGLGQTYEMISMYFYALYYYRKAVQLRPLDSRMWYALGTCFQRIDRRDEAIKALERAASCGDQEGIACLNLARLYASGEGSANERRAAENYRAHLDTTDNGSVNSDGVAEALKFLSSFAQREGALAVAAKYCSRLLECGGSEEEWAKQQLKDIRALEQGR